MNVSSALALLCPDASWTVFDESYDQIVWNSPDIPKPGVLEVEAKIEELKELKKWEILRKERDRLIAETDWWVLADRTPTDEQLAYRQALRDLPSTATPVLDPTSPLGISGVTWPTKPS